MLRLAVPFILAALALGVTAGGAMAGELTPTPTEERELTQPTPTPIDPPPFGDPAASRLIDVGGVYEIPPSEGDCGWAETSRVQALYRDYETVEVAVLTSNCNAADDIFIFYATSGELLRQRPDSERLRLQLVDGKVVIRSFDVPCTGFAETGRFEVERQGATVEVVNLAPDPNCGQMGFHYYPHTGELIPVSPGSAAPTATATSTGVTLPNTGAGSVTNLGGWVYIANAAVAGAALLGGLFVVTRRRD